jgi:hypothetical protein
MFNTLKLQFLLTSTYVNLFNNDTVCSSVNAVTSTVHGRTYDQCHIRNQQPTTQLS